MNSEIEQSADKDGEDTQAITEKPQFSGIASEENNEVCMASSCKKEIENGSPNNANENDEAQLDADATEAGEISENLQETPNVAATVEQERFNENAVVKEEPFNEVIDYGMPIAKATLDTNGTQSEENPDINAGLGSSGSEENHQEKANSEYLDGLVTPIMPRLRVKTEFALQAPPAREKSLEVDKANQTCDGINTEVLPPPPPLFFSSNSNTDIVADGIATPRLSLAPKNRLIRVKTEFSIPPGTPRHNSQQDPIVFPKDYFDDLLRTTNQDKEAGEISPATSDEGSEDEPIPADYFDDLLHDKCKERIQMAQNIELEEKYSDRLREYERLKNKEKSRKSRKKQKKSKKKSRKRSRSRSLSPNNQTKYRNDSFDLYNHDKNKRSRVSPLHQEMPSSSIYTNFEIKSEFPENNLESTGKEPATSIEDVDEIEEVLTPRQKRENAIKRAANLLKYIKETSDDDSAIFSTFSFISTVRKLPASHSYVQQQIYENRSPLHTVNNISYKFNSHISRFNMEEWGLSILPPTAAKIAKLVGCDAQFIHDKLKTIKIPAKLKKIKEEPNPDTGNADEEELIETTSSLYSNAMTQTDEISEFDLPRKKRGYEIGVQANPEAYSIASQTLETQSPTKDAHKDDDIPIMKLIHNLNENQLMAMHAFAELIKEPNRNDSAMEMYKIQMKILDIYKMSQIASVLPMAQPPISNNYTTKLNYNRNQPEIFIQSVKGADGKQFSVNDPRAKSTAYTQRIVHEGADSSRNYNSRHFSQHDSKHYFSSSRNSQAPRQYEGAAYNNTAPHTATTKHYGRGGLRR